MNEKANGIWYVKRGSEIEWIKQHVNTTHHKTDDKIDLKIKSLQISIFSNENKTITCIVPLMFRDITVKRNKNEKY